MPPPTRLRDGHDGDALRITPPERVVEGERGAPGSPHFGTPLDVTSGRLNQERSPPPHWRAGGPLASHWGEARPWTDAITLCGSFTLASAERSGGAKAVATVRPSVRLLSSQPGRSQAWRRYFGSSTADAEDVCFGSSSSSPRCHNLAGRRRFREGPLIRGAVSPCPGGGRGPGPPSLFSVAAGSPPARPARQARGDAHILLLRVTTVHTRTAPE
ncbi:hypothetical protein GGR56DRAFT_108198 [Xylariaceae sp. FL0804]|nr:hypothetical protein GGR56DRAFT_108198 [Xylariaceae sp. FL0804]